ncbi:diphthamide synthesis protein [Candidatus Pacearchaeota archaeon]|jgi:diphthamide biosynthesis enzyme Dph1/Dph2-like protein|nr:diphthamide synthesis protein [Candidatus Pacearchaeota archaeon]
MKTLFIPAKIIFEINSKKIQSLKLPKNIALAYSVQYKDVAEKIKQIISKKHKITSFIQVLGCSAPKFSKNTGAVLLISSGRFHAVSLALNSNIPVYILESDNLKKISEDEIENLRKKKKSAYLKFLNSEKIGILISTKPGQENFKRAISIQKKMKNKTSYLFLSNEINIKEFENFDIRSWINTACPRMDFDSPIINISDLENLL